MAVNKEINRKAIPFLIPDLPSVKDITPYLELIDKNRWYSNFGPLQHEFENELRCQFFKDFAVENECLVTCSSGTTAIELALLSLRLPKNAKILLPSFTFAATATAVIRAGYQPVFTEVDTNSWLLTPDIARNVLNYLTVDAVIPVAGLGMPQDVHQWDQFYEATGIPVVIDAAAALGEQQIGRHALVCFSMHATKGFGIGEGGMVLLPDLKMAKLARELSNFGFNAGIIAQAGSNYKLSEYHAAVGLAQIKRMSVLKKRRHAVRMHYRRWLGRLLPFFDVQSINRKPSNSGDKVVGFQPFGFRSAVAIKFKAEFEESLDDIAATLMRNGVGVRRWYHPVLHVHDAFCGYSTINPEGTSKLNFTESLNRSLLGLPFHNFLTREEVDYCCELIEHSLTSGKGVGQAGNQ